MTGRLFAKKLSLWPAGMLALLPCLGQALADTAAPSLPMKIPVLVIKYFPVKGDRIDQTVTGDWGAPLH